MAEVTVPAAFYDDNGVERLAGTITFPDGAPTGNPLVVSEIDGDPGLELLGAPSETANGGGISIVEAEGGDGGWVLIQGGNGDPGSGVGGSVNIQPGDADVYGAVNVRYGSGEIAISAGSGEVGLLDPTGDAFLAGDSNGLDIRGGGSGKIGFFGTAPVVRPTADDTAAGILAALVALGLVIDGS